MLHVFQPNCFHFKMLQLGKKLTVHLESIGLVLFKATHSHVHAAPISRTNLNHPTHISSVAPIGWLSLFWIPFVKISS